MSRENDVKIPFSADPSDRLSEPLMSTGFDQRFRESPEDYVIDDPGLVAAINAALILGQPLLLTGEPGTGKTQLASRIAWQLRLDDPLRFETKSNSESKDLFYTYDAVGRFNASNIQRDDAKDLGAANAANFIAYNALGKAILLTKSREEASQYVIDQDLFYKGRNETEYAAPCRSVVLIDEIDKAPRDFPNDLLNELGERMFFRIPEIDNREIRPTPNLRPIVVITSNSERNLPDPFLRRCVFYHIPFPSDVTLERILVARVSGLSGVSGSVLLKSAIEFFKEIRETPHRKPSTAELISWLRFLMESGARPDQSLADIPSLVHQSLGALAKQKREVERVQMLVQERFPLKQGKTA